MMWLGPPRTRDVVAPRTWVFVVELRTGAQVEIQAESFAIVHDRLVFYDLAGGVVDRNHRLSEVVTVLDRGPVAGSEAGPIRLGR